MTLLSPGIFVWPESLSLAVHFATGLLVGAAFFVALWWTVGHLSTLHPLLLVLSSIGRLALLGLVLLAVSREGAGPLLAMSLGIFVARLLVVRRARGARP